MHGGVTGEGDLRRPAHPIKYIENEVVIPWRQ